MTFLACKKNLRGIDNVASNFDFSNVNKRKGDFLLGTKVKYTCNSGYSANNGGEATCKSDGEWDPPVTCSIPSN